MTGATISARGGMREHLRAEIALRRRAVQDFGPDLIADPAWDLLLDLALSRIERRRICITSACIASGVAATTALRWIGEMVERGLIEREPDDEDRRRAWVRISDSAFAALAAVFDAREAKAA